MAGGTSSRSTPSLSPRFSTSITSTRSPRPGASRPWPMKSCSGSLLIPRIDAGGTQSLTRAGLSPLDRTSFHWRIHCYSRAKELIGFVTAADVHRRETCLKQDAGGQVAPLADLAIGGDLLAPGKLFETRS